LKEGQRAVLIPGESVMAETAKKWDVFISHAVEDQENFVRKLAATLTSLGVSVWYAETALRVGQSLSRSIDKGIAQSRFGIVVISQHFMKKHWPEYELRGLVCRESTEDSMILPVWHGVSKQQVADFSPSLADKFALDTAREEATDIALKLLRETRPDIYNKHPRAYLEKLASGEAMRELQEQIECARAQLEETQQELEEYKAQFTCPYCGAALSSRGDAPIDAEQKHWDVVEAFACGYSVFAGEVQSPCPSDPKFPRFEDFELRYTELTNDPTWKWSCVATGKTPMAKLLHLMQGLGRTQEEAANHVRESYQQYARRM
jgi:uncharacterized Zn-finger protein